MKSNSQLIGVLRPRESREITAYLVIASSNPFVTQPSKESRITRSICPKKLSSYCFYKITNFDKMSPTKIAENSNISVNEEEKPEIPENHQIHLIPVDRQSGEIMKENILRLESGVFITEKILYSGQLPKKDFLVFEKEWKTLIDSLTASQETQEQNKENSLFQTACPSDSRSESTTFLKRSNTRNESRLENSKQAACHRKFRTSKRIQRDRETVDKIGTTGSSPEVGGENQDLIKIEMKPDPDTQETFAGDLLRFKVTMYIFQETLGKQFDHQVEIDFVQNLLCEPVTQNACRCRRITKLLKRTTLTDLEWQKGMHISGNQLAITWISYRIPQLDGDGHELTENKMKKEHLRYDEGQVCDEKYERMFRVRDRQFELKIRVYEKVNSLGIEGRSENILVTCCCFPLHAMAIDD